MQNKIRAALKTLRGNRGSGIVLVLVCMICVSILGTLIMYLSYTGYMFKITERQSKADFYSATTAMDEIRAGVQKAASDSIAKAYKTALINYNNAEYINGTTMEKKFQEEFVDEFKNWTDSSGAKLVNNTVTDTGTYNTAVLASFTKGAAVNGDNVDTGTGTALITDNSVTLKGVSVTYTDAKGYTTSVTSDIVVSAPSFTYIVSNYSVSGLQSYALIADTELITGSTDTNSITGSVYAGKMTLQNDMTMDKGTVICKGTMLMKGASAQLTTKNDIRLWTNRIQVGELMRDGTKGLTLNGSSYVYDDLDLAGTGASATLSGSYYGFGNSTTDANKSSAILVNGRKASLNLSGLSRLMLAGHSFISDANMTANNTTDILMGESTSVRGNQMAYLVPVDCLEGAATNPLAYTGDQPQVSLKDNAKINGKALSEYGISLKPVYVNYPGSADQHMAYYFMQFDTAANANAFFSDYFTAKKSTITSYLKQYVTMTSTSGTVQSASYTIKQNGDDYSLVPFYSGSFETSSAQMISTFNQLTTTLFEKPSAANEYKTPYRYFVDTDKVDTVTGTKTFGNSGVVCNGDYRIDGSNPALRVVIASGDVTVAANVKFNGLIISGGTVTLGSGATVTADDAGVTAAFGTADLGSYLRHGASGGGKTDDKDSNTGWNLDKLVTYKNWSKN